ncbi:IS3 family transposase [Flavobacterium sp. FlaQc-47]|uniref:IS3 family transposase n=1 Tax=Flavobacterium sp. FlaQc-47 TaxID=3374180 RepID=UPI003756B92F
MTEIRKKYDIAFKKKAVLLSYERNCVGKLENELNLYSGAFGKWRMEYKKYGIESFQEKDYLKLNLEEQKIHKFEIKIKKSDLKLEILKRAGRALHLGKRTIYNFMKENERLYSIRMMSEVLGVNRSSYRRWRNQFITEKEKRKNLIKQEINSIFFTAKQRYGSERITVALRNSGYIISRRTVRKYMNELGLTILVKNN